MPRSEAYVVPDERLEGNPSHPSLAERQHPIEPVTTHVCFLLQEVDCQS